MSDSYTPVISNPGKWLRSDLNKEQAEAEYLGKQFRVKYSANHEMIVEVEKVRLYGGVVLTFCSLVKVLKRWDNPKAKEFKAEVIHAGRLEKL